MNQKKPSAVALCVQDMDGQVMGAIAITDDTHMNVESVAGDFIDCLDKLSVKFELDDDPSSVEKVTKNWLQSKFEDFDPVSVFFDETSGTTVRRLVKYVQGGLEAETIGYVCFEPGKVSGVKLRLQDALPPAHEKAPYTPKEDSNQARLRRLL
ncbi:hypothetical protein [Xanthomonas hortorum]|uniref:hypothetical protein n=1 Tax=Xanthomonas hortorum TaxID=56454 RepID=UPI001E326D51|nr:hypothetical protein [Xanthomonas hortorum]MCC8553504.1 hypothetical protein [Xanthomonas hortorum pv. gardneri]